MLNAVPRAGGPGDAAAGGQRLDARPAAEGRVAAYRRAAARAGGCAARAPSLEALALAWRLRADALALAAAHAGAADAARDTATRGGRAGRLRGLARAWASGAARLAGGSARGPRWHAWFDDYLARSSALPGEGPAWAVMRAEHAVWCLAGARVPA